MIITFERATPADAPTLTGVQMRSFDDDTRRFGSGESGGPPGYDSADWQIEMMQRSIYYKILADGQIVGGIILFQFGPDHMEVGRIYLDPAYQDRGIGTQAFAFIEAAYPAIRRWTLDTPAWAVRNHHFYEKLGYVKMREAEGHSIRLVCYEKQVNP